MGMACPGVWVRAWVCSKAPSADSFQSRPGSSASLAARHVCRTPGQCAMTPIGPGSVSLSRSTNRNFQITKGEIMTLETSLIDSALRNWRSNVDRAGNLFGNLSQEQLLQEVAPGKNRV